MEYAPVMELVDMRDLGSRAFSVWVRVPSGAPETKTPLSVGRGVFISFHTLYRLKILRKINR